MKNRRVVIIGAGHVGSHCATAIAGQALCSEVVLIDADPVKAQAQAEDISDGMGFSPSPVTVRSGDYGDCDNADIIIMAFGRTRLPGETKNDLLSISVKIADDVVSKLKSTSFHGIIISITNPCDVIAAYIREKLEYERWRCFGTGTLLDTARLIRILSEETGCPASKIHAIVLGEHGDTSVVPFSSVRIGEIPLDKFDISADSVLRKTRAVGTEVMRGKGSTEFGIANATAAIVESIFEDDKKLFSISAALDGEYGQTGVQCGVPCIIGKNGIESIEEIPLTDGEKRLFDISCDAVRDNIKASHNIKIKKHF